jgi:tetratricopeptide (TPR) repeat protein
MVFFIGCTTEKNTPTTRAYHNITAKYNVYFNSYDAYKRGMNRISTQYSENYTQLLPIFPESNEVAAGAATGDMDRAIVKASKAIKIHSITVKPERKGNKQLSEKDKAFYEKNEYCKWIDDSYLIMGKAYLIKRDFLQARQNFEYIIRQYPEEDTRYQAYLYLTRTFIEQKNYHNAKEILDMLQADREFPDELKKDKALVHADFYLRQKQFDEAIPQLNSAIEEIRRHKHKVRYIYILAQIHEELGNLRTASELYAKAVSKNPDYEMEFNAKISMARCYVGEGQDIKDIYRLLSKMLKDDKNIEYLDQIYYAIAELDLRTGNVESAISNLKLSSETSIMNEYQKAISCLKLGELYFQELDYKNSQIYYDTCMMFLPYNYENYREIKRNADNLSELVLHVNIVEFQDSVQKIALLTDAERNKLIDGIIAEVIEKERLEKEMERQDQMNSMLFDERRGHNPNVRAPSSGKWYLYDPAQLSFGQNEFRKKWGNRKNEDHWRRKNKAIIDDFNDLDTNMKQDSVDGVARITNEKSREFYLQDVPLTDSMMQVSHQKILNALYQMGRIYKENFENYMLAITAYEDLNARYPDNEYLLISYYNLYILSKLTNQDQKAQTYKDLLIAKFPDTHYAKLLKNPNYIVELEQKRKEEERLYIEAYDNFMDGRCGIVNNKVKSYLEQNPEGEYVANFEYLRVLCIGKTADTSEFKMALVQYMSDYPEHELYVAAQNILNYFGTTNIEGLIADLKSRPEPMKNENLTGVVDTVGGAIERKLFEFNELDKHFYVLKIKSDKVDEKRVSFEIRNYNIFTFSLRTFTVNTASFDDKHQLVVVKSFDNSRQATNYRNMISGHNDVFGRMNAIDYQVFVISESNYFNLIQSKNIQEYLQFYRQNYP